MSESINQFDPRHPHERDGRNERPIIDKNGRCLVCCRDYSDELKVANKSLRANLDLMTESHEAAKRRVGELEKELSALRVGRERDQEAVDSLVAKIAEAVECLRPVMSEVKNRGVGYSHKSWNPDAHVEITLTIAEIRKIAAFVAENGANRGK